MFLQEAWEGRGKDVWKGDNVRHARSTLFRFCFPPGLRSSSPSSSSSSVGFCDLEGVATDLALVLDALDGFGALPLPFARLVELAETDGGGALDLLKPSGFELLEAG
jgi:hypothetical protein